MRKILSFVIILLLIGVTTSSITGFSLDYKPSSLISSEDSQNINNNITGITPFEAWKLLTNTSNGIQHPIDIRNDTEWDEGFIDTPYPEHPIHYRFDWFKNDTKLNKFLNEYNNKEVIFYDKGGSYRILILNNILIENNYTGVGYYIIGGITAWIEAGLPIRSNTPPNAPNVTGSLRIKAGREQSYCFEATDPDGDCIRYLIDWTDGATHQWTDLHPSGEEITVNHTFKTKGTYNISSFAVDMFGAKGPWGWISIEVPKSNQINSQPVFLQQINPEIESFNNKYDTIYFIRGRGWINRDYGKIGEMHNLEILTEKGYLNMTSIAINPLFPLRFNFFYPRFLYIPLFYGICIGSPVPYSPHRIIGIAFGNIEWS